MPAPKALAAAIAKVAARIKKPASGKLNEQNTKATLIEPILRALGWDTEDVDEVVREFRHRPARRRGLARDERVELLDAPRWRWEQAGDRSHAAREPSVEGCSG